VADSPVPTVDFPAETSGERSTSAFGRAVVADALDPIDQVGARAARAETSWRSGYLPHFRRLIEAGIGAPGSAHASAAAGLASVSQRMAWTGPDGDVPLTALDWAGTAPGTLAVEGTGERVDELAIPHGGRALRGAALSAQLERWVEAGAMEPTVAESVRLVADNPDWLSLPGHTLVALGASSEMGPTPTLLSWGATVAGIDLPDEKRWSTLMGTASSSAGRLLVPVRGSGGAVTAGLDLLRELTDAAAWIEALDGDLVLGNYVYADGGTNLRLSAATDALAGQVQGVRTATLAFLATPTDVFAVPGDAVEHSVRAYESRGGLSRMSGRLLRGATGGRLLARAYLPGSDPGVCDALVPQQGPNYALGKRLHRWRATAERADGRRVSMNVAPPTRTQSVVKNKALAAAYAGAHRFGVEIFEPETTRVLMAALLVRDLMAERPAFDEPWQDEAYDAVHGGLWRTGFAPRSALGLAAVLGYGSAR
jgi:hypothetical protein